LGIKKAHHPGNRDERQTFRGTTRIRRNPAQLKSAITLATDNGVTRRALLVFSGGSSWEKARYCTEADRTIPPSLNPQTNTRQPSHSFFHIRWNINIFTKKMQALFHN